MNNIPSANAIRVSSKYLFDKLHIFVVPGKYYQTQLYLITIQFGSPFVPISASDCAPLPLQLAPSAPVPHSAAGLPAATVVAINTHQLHSARPPLNICHIYPIHSIQSIAVIRLHIVLHIPGLEGILASYTTAARRSLSVRSGCGAPAAALPIGVEHKAGPARAVVRAGRIVTVLVAWLALGALVAVLLAVATRKSGRTAAHVRLDAFASILAGGHADG